MSIRVRHANPATDYARVAAIMNTHEPELVTEERMHELDARDFEGQIRQRFVAEDGEGNITAYGVAMHSPWMTHGRFFTQVIVDPAYRCGGVGTQVYDACVAYARSNGATTFETWVFENQPDGVRFAEKRGFKVEAHLFESTIDLQSFDETPFAGVIEAAQTGGVRLLSLADVGNTRDNLYKLWEVNYRTYLDDPSSTGTFPSFEEFQKITGESWFRPEGQFIAVDGDRFVGIAAVGHFRDSNSAYNMMTGLLPEYRGRKLAQALKLLTIRAAKAWGVDYIRTNNDSQNAPMLAINYKLGYVPQPGGYRMTTLVENPDPQDNAIEQIVEDDHG